MRLRAGVACCLLLSVMVLLLPVITTGQSDQEIIQRIAELEQWILDNPGVFDWNVHNELRHLYLLRSDGWFMDICEVGAQQSLEK